jgi:hypothetical protein
MNTEKIKSFEVMHNFGRAKEIWARITMRQNGGKFGPRTGDWTGMIRAIGFRTVSREPKI